MGNSRLLKMSAKLFEPVDVASLAFFRVTFGLIMVWNVYHYWLDAENSFLLPIFHFKYYGFSWVKALPGDWIYYLLALLGFLALLITVGLLYRIAAALFFIGLIYVFLLTKELYLNHMYLVCLLSFLLIFIPCYRSFSLDALINPKIRSQVIPAWCLWLVRGQIGIVYFYAGLAKLNPDWLHGEPVRLWLAPLASYPVLGQFFTKEWFVYLVSYGGLGFDLLIVPLLLFRKTRVIGYLWAIMFHLLNVYIFEIGIFPWLMIVATLIFFSPSWPRRVLAGIQRKKLDMEEAAPMPKLSPFYRYSAMLFVTVYLALQLLIPFRHFLYPGNVSWTEEGHRFSWRMKLRDKRSHVIYYVTDPKSQRTWELPPESILRLLTPWQYLKMSIRPDMILEFSHYLAEHFKQNGFPDVEVRARILNSLNGRPHQLLIDPEVDLAKVRARLWPPATWIIPHSELK